MRTSLGIAQLLISLLLPTTGLAVDITVNPSSVIKTSSKVPLGLGLNQMIDSTLSLDSLKTVVIQSGAKYLRFPEGETADNYYFTDPAYLSNPKPSTARVANTKYWPVGTSLANSNGNLPKGLNFDQFMSVVGAAGATPNVVLCYPCGDKVKALEMAKAWVKYSKDKAYNVLNWEMGNESYIFNPNYTDEYEMTAAEYAKDIVEWSVALKAIDPRIKIGVNGKTKEWFNTLLKYKHPSLNKFGAESIDFLAVHLYPMYGSSFSAYQQNQNAYGTLNFLGDVNPALNALQESASTASTSHIKIAITECSTMNYSITSDLNNMGSAIMTVDLLTELSKHPQIDYIELWASRWIKNFSSSTPQGSDTFSSKNKLNPSGLALSAVTKFMKDNVVSAVGGTASLKVFASRSSATGEISIMLLNRDNAAQNVSLSVLGATSLTGKRYSFTAASATSTTPTFDKTGVAVKSSTSSILVSVPKTSFLFLTFTGISTTPPVAKNFIQNASFESGAASWSDWGNSVVVKSDAVEGNYSLKVGASAGGAAQTITGLNAATSYVFKGKAKLSSASEKAWFRVTFYDANGSKIAGADYSTAITSTAYQSYSLNITAPAAFTSAQVWIWKDAGSGFVFCDELSLTPW